MNAFREHHEDSIRFGYRCFDRLLLNGLIQPFQQPERVVRFFTRYRDQYPVTRQLLRDIANQYHAWIEARARERRIPILAEPDGRRDEFVDRFFRRATPDDVVVILKAREPARILTAIGTPTDSRWHLQFAQRGVVHDNIYLNDRRWGRLFVRVCPYFPFSARVCLNQHHWLANRLRDEGIAFRQCKNAFLQCSDPDRLQSLADSLSAHDLITCGQKWLRAFTPFFTAEERREAGGQQRLFFAQTEDCDNLIFQRRAARDQLGARLLDANRTIGQPDSITTIFGRRVTTPHHGKLQRASTTSICRTPSSAATTATASSSSTSATTCCSARSPRPTTWATTVSAKPSSISPRYASGSPVLSIRISTSSRTSSRPLWTAANFGVSRNPRCSPPASASPV
jgi:hypothetical protein